MRRFLYLMFKNDLFYNVCCLDLRYFFIVKNDYSEYVYIEFLVFCYLCVLYYIIVLLMF